MMSEQIPVSRSPEEEPQIKRVFLEIGTSSSPVPFIGEKEMTDDEIYIGVDVKREALEDAKSGTEATQHDTPGRKNLYFIEADAISLPLKSGSAGEVFLGNIIGDPKISVPRKRRFLEEARRVIQGKDGTIIIKETNTPADRVLLEDLIRESGLEIIREVTPKSPEWEKEIGLYDRTATRKDYPFDDSYLIYLRVKNE